jgi:hypothetical protein
MPVTRAHFKVATAQEFNLFWILLCEWPKNSVIPKQQQQKETKEAECQREG